MSGSQTHLTALNPQVSENNNDYNILDAATAELHKRILAEHNSQKLWYYLIAWAYDLLSILQIMLGATITALGPTADQHMVPVTVLGALSTIVGGALALIKGRGLPQRIRKNMAELGNVIDYIEEKKLLLRYGNTSVSREEVVSFIQESFQRYITARGVIKRSEPDSYNNVTRPPTANSTDNV